MSWMNASAAAAADRRNAELSAWDHSVESPDGYGRRDADDCHLAAVVDAEEARKDALRTELKGTTNNEEPDWEAMIAGMMAEESEMNERG